MLLLTLLLACSPDSEMDSADEALCPEAPEPTLTLPADDAMHTEDVEWWYWTGHLSDESGREYGFEHVVFVFQVAGAYLATSAHLALTDIEAQEFRYEVEYLHGELPEVLTESFVLEVEDSSAIGADGSDTLQASFSDVSWNLDLEAQGVPMLQHGDGYHDYDAGGYTWYYSRPRIDITGELSIDGDNQAVSGEGWFDHQWGALTDISNAGWDWFAMQLEDGREIMLFLTSGTDELVGGSIRDGDCVTEIDPSTLVVSGTEEWTSEATGCSYPQRWELQVEGESFVLESVLEDQEVANSYNTYWEGAARVSGSGTGKAYIELAGRCD
jgi:predicted secreted hydrolase